MKHDVSFRKGLFMFSFKTIWLITLHI